MSRTNVLIFGAGKVGVGLAKALRRVGIPVVLRPARKGNPRRPVEASMVILAVRDPALPVLAKDWADRRLVKRGTVVVHCAGALSADVLGPLRAVGAHVAQMHPMISFASTRFTPSLAGGQLRVAGDTRAVVVARGLGRKLGMIPRALPSLDPVLYHAAAGLVANSAAALAAAGMKVLAEAGVHPSDAQDMLGHLLGSVGENVATLGLPQALTGPVRRGDSAGVDKHLRLLARTAPSAIPIYLAGVRLQLPLARSIGDAPPPAWGKMARVLAMWELSWRTRSAPPAKK